MPTHPHLSGEPRSNRPPSTAEIDAAAGFLSQLLAGRRVLAVGRLAHERLGGTYIRHPSHGGAAEFHAGLAAALA